MGKLFYCLLIILPIVIGQENDSSLKGKLGAKLVAETTVKNAVICIDSSGFDAKFRTITSVRSDLTLRVVYKNVGTYPIILDKLSGTIGGQKIYHSPQNGNASLIEYDARLDIIAGFLTPRKEGDAPSNSFVILKPGEQYEGKAETRLLIDYPEQYQHLSSDVHYLRFAMWTAMGTLHQANNLDELRTRWKAIGYFWTEGITTEPMEMRFPKLADIGKCQ